MSVLRHHDVVDRPANPALVKIKAVLFQYAVPPVERPDLLGICITGQPVPTRADRCQHCSAAACVWIQHSASA